MKPYDQITIQEVDHFMERMGQAIRFMEILIAGKHPCKLHDKLWDLAIKNMEIILHPPILINKPPERQ